VFNPPLDRQETPVHSVSVPSVANVTDFGGEAVRHSVDVRAFCPKLESISQLMFFEGETNSVVVDVWGTSVPEVCEVLDVVGPAVLEVVEAAVVVVATEVVVVVDEDDEDDEDGPLEQAARAAAQAGRIIRRTDRLRSAIGISRAYVREPARSGLWTTRQASAAQDGGRPTVRKAPERSPEQGVGQ
jgi:hypothetical protein